MIAPPGHSVRTAAKINLVLTVGPRGDDGYHEVATVLQTIDLGDDLSVDATDTGQVTLEVTGSVDTGPVEDNLVVQAARMYLAEDGRGRSRARRRGVRLRLAKRVPAGAGLGGGSGDAAATLLLLARHLGDRHEPRRLMGMARRLGTDVPFFLRGGLARGVGRGDRVRELAPLPPLPVLVMIPPFSLGTAAVYGWMDGLSLTSPRSQFTMRPVLAALRARRRAGPLNNHFQDAVFRRYPELAMAVSRMDEQGALIAGLSGSGSALFGVFEHRRDADAVVAGWQRPDWTTVVSQTLDGPAYRARFR
ncbi:MAG: 4-(cytidine 5'-diphospho)-2-C-methyl-D-erythritol kinase [Acidobacteriota bacterium]